MPDIGHYAELRATTRPDLEPLPHLFVVIDEFGELLTAKPDFIDLFLSVGRIGRSIGVHLLLSSQRIESGKLKGLDTYLSYRLGLRTFSADESRTVLDTTDAFHLPPLPGFGYLKVDTSTYERFKAGYVSGAHHGPAAVEQRPDEPLVLPYPVFNTQERVEEREEAPATARKETGPTVLSLMVDRLTEAAPAVRRIWLPPLPDAVTLDAGRRPGRGLRTRAAPGACHGRDAGAARRAGRPRPAVAGTVDAGSDHGKRSCGGDRRPSVRQDHAPPHLGAVPGGHPHPRDVAVYGLDLVGGGCRRWRACPTSAVSRAGPTANAPPGRSPRYAPFSTSAKPSSASTASTPSTSSAASAPRESCLSSAPRTSSSSSTGSGPCATTSPTSTSRSRTC